MKKIKISKTMRWFLSGILFVLTIILIWVSQNAKKGSSFEIYKAEQDSYTSTSLGTAAVLNARREGNLFIVNGFAAVKTREDNWDKKVKWILQSKTEYYEIECNVYYYIRDLQIEEIQESNKGFYCEIDLSQLPDGKYESYLWVQENKTAQALIDMDFDFIKEAQEVYLATPEKQDNFTEIPYLDLILSLGESLDFDFVDGFYLIRGCAYVEGKDSKQTEMYLQVRDSMGNIQTYPLKLRYSLWADESLGNQYAWFDFSTILSEAQLPKTDLSLRILAVNEGVHSTNNEMSYIYKDEKYIRSEN